MEWNALARYSCISVITGTTHLWTDNHQKIVPINILISLYVPNVSQPIRIISAAEVLRAPPIRRAPRRDIITRMHAKQHRDLHPRRTVKVQMTAVCILMLLRSLVGSYVARLSYRTLSRYIRALHTLILNKAPISICIYTPRHAAFFRCRLLCSRIIELTSMSKWMRSLLSEKILICTLYTPGTLYVKLCEMVLPHVIVMSLPSLRDLQLRRETTVIIVCTIILHNNVNLLTFISVEWSNNSNMICEYCTI